MLLMKSGSEHRLKASVFQALTAITFIEAAEIFTLIN